MAKGAHCPTLFSSYAVVKVWGGAFTLCICLVPSQEYDFIIYLKMRLVFLYTLLGLHAAAQYLFYPRDKPASPGHIASLELHNLLEQNCILFNLYNVFMGRFHWIGEEYTDVESETLKLMIVSSLCLRTMVPHNFSCIQFCFHW